MWHITHTRAQTPTHISIPAKVNIFNILPSALSNAILSSPGHFLPYSTPSGIYACLWIIPKSCTNISINLWKLLTFHQINISDDKQTELLCQNQSTCVIEHLNKQWLVINYSWRLSRGITSSNVYMLSDDTTMCLLRWVLAARWRSVGGVSNQVSFVCVPIKCVYTIRCTHIHNIMLT